MTTPTDNQHPYLLVGFPDDDPDIKVYLDGATGLDQPPPLMTLGPIAEIAESPCELSGRQLKQVHRSAHSALLFSGADTPRGLEINNGHT